MQRNKFVLRFDNIRDLGRTVGSDIAFRQLSDGAQSIGYQLLFGRKVVVLSGADKEGVNPLAHLQRGLATWLDS